MTGKATLAGKNTNLPRGHFNVETSLGVSLLSSVSCFSDEASDAIEVVNHKVSSNTINPDFLIKRTKTGRRLKNMFSRYRQSQKIVPILNRAGELSKYHLNSYKVCVHGRHKE
ncbi:hypothetical protein CEXT_63251 [Caerostris extrusa]|uniref:Uncharacterized protein n=1 Tax=Caerostris extrusa TaxID=172846 RepID=A0AAV4RED4_CAEEX|nr:hypothetical protein CEXT_63251 [Caerostris extrusa]